MSTEGITGYSNIDQSQGTSNTADGQNFKPLNSSSSKGFSNLAKLKEESPEVWNKMLQAMASEINNESRKHAEKMKKLMREGQR